MSANNARRRRSHRTEPVDLGEWRTERLHALVALRNQLAAAHAAYEAHGLEDALAMLQQMLQIESSIRAIAPDFYHQRWSDWAERDVKLMHSPGEYNEHCHICQMVQAAAQISRGPQGSAA